MKQNDIENRLKRAVEQSVPDVFDGILSGCAQSKGTVVPMTEKKKTKTWKYVAGVVAAALVLVCGIYGLVARNQQHVDAIVAFDVNPSIELQVSRDEKVLSAIAVNADAEGILDGMDLRGTNLDVAVNALIGSMLKNGYLDELANSILISVENDDMERGAALQQRLTEEVNQLLAAYKLDGAVLSQTIAANTELQSLAEQYGISSGKAALIQTILEQNPLQTFESLAGLTVNELNLLIGSKTTELPNVTSTGTASDKAYIGEAKAKEIAIAYAKVTAADAQFTEVKLDCDGGKMVYDVEFIADGIEYDFEIDAQTGDVYAFEVDRNEHGTVTGNVIDVEAAKQAALQHAGIAANDATFTKAKLDRDDGKAIYDIEFYAGGKEYEYEIDAETGSVYQFEVGNAQNVLGNTDAFIGLEAAKSKALSDAGVAAGGATFIKAKLDDDDGKMVYDIEFYADGKEYEYEIDAQTGAVHKKEVEGGNNTQPTADAYIGLEAAKSKALSHAGVKADNATFIKAVLDRDDYTVVYDIEFLVNGREYDYEIDAITGDVRKAEIDHTDAPSTTSGNYITSEKAKQVALQHAGVSTADVRGLSVEFDYDDGRALYEVEFKSGYQEYDYKIDAVNGSILQHHVEIDD